MSEEVKDIKVRGLKSKDKELSPEERRRQALETTLAGIDKAYGKGAIINMAARPTEHRWLPPRPYHRDLRPRVLG